jgi:uncharacterized protein (DUF1330 family)
VKPLKAAQLELFYNYRKNLERYPEWHEYFRTHQPPTLIVWGKNDPFFGPEGAKAFERDLTTIETHLLDTGHFALDEEVEAIEGVPTGSQSAVFEWPSRQVLLDYWYSNKYAAIKKLREGAVEFQGVIVEGVAG